MIKRLLVLLILCVLISITGRGQYIGYIDYFLKATQNERAYYLKDFMNTMKDITHKMLLVPTQTEDGAVMWKKHLSMLRGNLTALPLDINNRVDEDYYNMSLAYLHSLFFVCCDSLPGREEEAYNNVLISKNFINSQLKWQDISDLSWKSVQNMLDEGEVAIELCVLPDEALIIKKGLEKPVSVRIDSLLMEKLGLYKGDDPLEISNAYSEKGILAELWKTIEPYVSDSKVIYLSASNYLCQYNYGVIPLQNGNTVSDVYDYHYLVSTADIAHVKDAEQLTKYNDAVLFGDITYDMDYDDMMASASESSKSTCIPWDLTRGMDESTRGRLQPLANSKKEIENIGSHLKSMGVEVKVLSGKMANEESFKEICSKKPDIIHLSTHGFMVAQRFSDNVDIHDTTSISGSSKYASTLLKSGLLLAGSNRVWNGGQAIDGVEDGILTSMEISEMDLKGVKLAVLSACKTGLGNDTNLTGLSYGPQHALKTAGVDKVVMSLWMVDDAATSLLMQYLYENLIQGFSVRESLRLAQKRLIKSGFYEPYYWAGFIVLD